MPGHELQNRGLTETSRTRNAVPGECYSDTTGSSESWGWGDKSNQTLQSLVQLIQHVLRDTEKLVELS